MLVITGCRPVLAGGLSHRFFAASEAISVRAVIDRSPLVVKIFYTTALLCTRTKRIEERSGMGSWPRRFDALN